MREVYFYEYKSKSDIPIVFIPPCRIFADLDTAEKQWTRDNQNCSKHVYLTPIQHGWLPDDTNYTIKGSK
jgi:hypothetical protein